MSGIDKINKENPAWFVCVQGNSTTRDFLIQEGELTLDATCGSGTTGLAAVSCGRRFIGFEKEKNFYDISRMRIEKVLAKKAQELF